MRAKTKAKELFDSFLKSTDEKGFYNNNIFRAKNNAKISVDEILSLMINEFKWDKHHNGNIEYWEEVKKEIDKI
jgi:hypothetical protein